MRPLRRRSCSTKNLTIHERPLGAILQHVVAGDGACCASVFLPSLSSLHVENVVDGGASLSISVRTRTTQAICPQCTAVCVRVHARHERRLHDVLGGRPVVIRLVVQRLPGSPGGIAPPGPHRSVRKPLGLHGSCRSVVRSCTAASSARTSAGTVPGPSADMPLLSPGCVPAACTSASPNARDGDPCVCRSGSPRSGGSSPINVNEPLKPSRRSVVAARKPASEAPTMTMRPVRRKVSPSSPRVEVVAGKASCTCTPSTRSACTGQAAAARST
jgi:hypothetical protein